MRHAARLMLTPQSAQRWRLPPLQKGLGDFLPCTLTFHRKNTFPMNLNCFWTTLAGGWVECSGRFHCIKYFNSEVRRRGSGFRRSGWKDNTDFSGTAKVALTKMHRAFSSPPGRCMKSNYRSWRCVDTKENVFGGKKCLSGVFLTMQWSLDPIVFSLYLLCSTEEEKRSNRFENDVRVNKWWQDFHFWSNYAFNCSNYATYSVITLTL